MAKKQKWIQNTYRSGIQINIMDEVSSHELQYVFNAYKVDKISGRVVTDGFTVLDEEDYERLAKSKSFEKCVRESKLVVYNEPPAAALSDVDRMLLLQEEVRTLRAENASLKQQLEAATAPKETKESKPKATKAKAE